MSRKFLGVAAVTTAAALAALAPMAGAQSDNDNNDEPEAFFAKLNKDGGGAVIVELRGNKRVCVTVAMRRFTPDKVDIKAKGSKGKFKVDENGDTDCQNESGLSRRLRDGDKGKVTVKGDGDRSSGKLDAAHRD